MLDPYYRTIEGFQVLIEKDWMSFGHQFSRRSGHFDRRHSDDQRSPIFIQFIDCVFQMVTQLPLHFEYSKAYL
jgi:Myotubularin-like phosphatase domain